jgi:hypothetical protein
MIEIKTMNKKDKKDTHVIAVELANSLYELVDDLTDDDYSELVGRFERFLYVFFNEKQVTKPKRLYVKRSKSHQNI